MPKLSIVIPVYNSLPYLERTMKSVLEQTFRDFELILVDDGSTDGSGDFCDEIAERDCRIRVIHQENKGVSETRAAGVIAAGGDYLSFIDSDDFLLPHMYERMFSAMQESGADLIRCGFIIVPESSIPRLLPATEQGFTAEWRDNWEKRQPKDAVFDTQSFIRYFFDGYHEHPMWQTIFKRELIKGHFFDKDLRRAADFSVWLHLFDDDPDFTARTIPDCLYVYIKRTGSITASRNLLESQLRVSLQALRYFDKSGFKKLYGKEYRKLVNWSLSGKLDVSKNSSLPELLRKEILGLLRKSPWIFILTNTAPISAKFKFIFLILIPDRYHRGLST